MDAENRRNFDDLLRGLTRTLAEFQLASSPATSTLVARRGVSSSSAVLLMPASNASYADLVRVIPAKDAFTVVHTSSTTARFVRLVHFTGQ